MSTSATLGITPDLTTYSNTTKNMIDKWVNVLESLHEDWEVIMDDYGEVVDALPVWSIKFKDGSESKVTTKGKSAKPSVGIYTGTKSASKRDTQSIINKHTASLKNAETDFLVAKNKFDEVAAILPRRRFTFKSNDDIVEALKHVPHNNGGK